MDWEKYRYVICSMFFKRGVHATYMCWGRGLTLPGSFCIGCCNDLFLPSNINMNSRKSIHFKIFSFVCWTNQNGRYVHEWKRFVIHFFHFSTAIAYTYILILPNNKVFLAAVVLICVHSDSLKKTFKPIIWKKTFAIYNVRSIGQTILQQHSAFSPTPSEAVQATIQRILSSILLTSSSRQQW